MSWRIFHIELLYFALFTANHPDMAFMEVDRLLKETEWEYS